MSKIIAVIFSLLVVFIANISILTNIVVAVEPPVCNSTIGVTYETDPKPISEKQPAIVMKFDGLKNNWYRLRFASGLPGNHVPTPEIQAQNGKVILFISNSDGKLQWGDHNATLEESSSRTGPWSDYCKDVKYTVGYKPEQCRIAKTPPDPTDLEQIRIDVADMPAGDYYIIIERGNALNREGTIQIDNYGNGTSIIGPFNPLISQLSLISETDYVSVEPGKYQYCKIPLVVKGSAGQSPRPLPSGSAPPIPPALSTCDPKTDPKCTTGGGISCDPPNPAIQTAIGCIHTNPTDLVQDVLKFAIGIGGGLAFLMMLLGAFQMVTSAGNPETLAAGKDRLTSAIIGLLFVIFAVLLLQIIGAGILDIPGFGK